MTRYLLTPAALLALALPLFAQPAAPPLDPPAAPAVSRVGEEIAAAVLPQDAAVRIGVREYGGSGVCVYADGEHSLILTNRHVVEHVGPDAKVTVHHTGKPADGWVMGWGDDDDIALVWTHADIPAAKVAEEYPAPGSTVTMWGFGGRADGTPPGRLNAKAGKAVGYGAARTMQGGAIYETTFLSISGDSGAGVFNEAGELVAVNWGNDGRNSCCVGLTTVRTFVKVKAGPRFPRLAKLLGRPPAPQAPAAPKAAAPKCVDGCPCPSNPPAAMPPATPIPKAAAPASPARCTLQPVYDRRGNVVGYRQVCPQQ